MELDIFGSISVFQSGNSYALQETEIQVAQFL